MLTDEQITEGSSEPSEPAAFARIREVLEYFDCKAVLELDNSGHSWAPAIGVPFEAHMR